MNRDGEIQQQVTMNDFYDGEADWSPDGNSFAFVSRQDGWTQIAVCEVVKCIPRPLGGPGGVLPSLGFGKPVWIPYGNALYFVTLHDGKYCIVMQFTDATSHIIMFDNPQWNDQDPDV